MINRTLAQLVERLPYTQNVVSSNLAGPTKQKEDRSNV